MNQLRLLPLSLLMSVAGVWVAGCDLLLPPCDAELDEACEDATRAQITGVITIPQAGGASTGHKALSLAFQELRHAVAAAAQAQKRHRPVDTTQRRRVPKPGHGADFEISKFRVEKFRPGEVVVRALEPIRGRKAEISRALSIWLND